MLIESFPVHYFDVECRNFEEIKVPSLHINNFEEIWCLNITYRCCKPLFIMPTS